MGDRRQRCLRGDAGGACADDPRLEGAAWRTAFSWPALGALCLVVVVFMTTPVTEGSGGLDPDGVIYAAMARHDADPQQPAQPAPWSYRILTPFLASRLPWDLMTNFRVLALVSNVLSLWIWLRILALYGFSEALRWIGLLLYAGTFWTLKFSFYAPAYIDYQSQMFLLLIVYFTLSRSYVPLLISLALAAVQKESLAAFSLFSAAHVLRTGLPMRHVLLSVLLVSVPFAAAWAVRCCVGEGGGYSVLMVIGIELARLWNPAYWLGFCQVMYSGLGLIPALLAVQYAHWMAFLRGHGEWVVYGLITGACMFGGVDKARLLLYSLPLAVLLCLQMIDGLKGVPKGRLLRWAGVILVCHWFMGGYLTPMSSHSDYLARWVPEHSDGQYVPFLLRNFAISILVFVFTGSFLIRDWRFRLAVGFGAGSPPSRAAGMEET